MTSPPDLRALARRYVELWQDQVAASATDPELTGALTRLLELAGGNLAASAHLWQTLWPAPPAAPRDQPVPAPAGSAPAAAAPADGGGHLEQLALRVAALEERLAALESGADRPRRGARPRPRKRAAS
jgi:hypothetical protein